MSQLACVPASFIRAMGKGNTFERLLEYIMPSNTLHPRERALTTWAATTLEDGSLIYIHILTILTIYDGLANVSSTSTKDLFISLCSDNCQIISPCFRFSVITLPSSSSSSSTFSPPLFFSSPLFFPPQLYRISPLSPLPLPPQNNFSDIFDDQFVSALALYQNRLGLSVTGKLDSQTIASIMSPRCGISDLTKFNNNGSTIHSTRRYAFFNGQPRWIRASTLTYALSPDYTIDYLTSSEIRKVVRRSFSRWSAVIPLNFTESSDYDSSDIRIGFYRGDHGDGEAFDGVLGVLAHAFSPENGRLHLDAAERWAVDFEKEKSKVAVDLESVVTHEIGHVLGLAHSAVKESVMYPSLSPRGKKVDLRIDDVEGIQVLYGTNPNFKLESFLESEKSMNNNGSSSSSSNNNSKLLFLLFFYLLIMIW